MKNKKLKIFITTVLLMIVACIQTVVAVPKPKPTPTKKQQVFVHTESFVQDHSVSALFSESTEYFSIEDWNIQKAEFVMLYKVTPLYDQKISDFTVSLNGIPFHSGRFKEARGEMQTVKMNIPVRLLKNGINELKIESYVRTKDALPCVDDVSRVNWLHIAKDSTVNVSYTPKKNGKSIADVYKKVTGIYAIENQKSAIIIPDATTDNIMTATANVLTGIAQNAKIEYEDLMLLTSDRVFSKNTTYDLDYGICISEWDLLPEEIKNKIPQTAKKIIIESGAILSVVTVDDMDLLVLTGTSAESLEKGARMFGNPNYMEQMTKAIHVITKEENPIMEKKEYLNYSTLTKEGAYVDGAFRQTFSFQQTSYANKMFSPASQIYLKMRYAKNIDFERSLMTVYINDVPIGSHKLLADRADGDEVEMYLPADLNVTGDFQVKVAFDLEVEDLYCTLRQEETPWAYVSPESMMKLVLSHDAPLLLEHYPAPFLEAKSMNQVFLALPEKPTLEDIEAMKGICLTLGRFCEDNAGRIYVKQGAKKEDCRGKNVIVIGTFQNNSMIRESNEDLYFQFNEDGTAFLTNEKKRITREAGETMGTIQLIPNPLEKEARGMLFVTGATPEAMLSASHYLSDVEKLWQLTGDGCVTTEEKIETYQFKKVKNQMVETTKELVERDDVHRLLVVAISISVVLIFGLLLIIVKQIRRGKEKKRK